MEAVNAGGIIDVRAGKASHWQNPRIKGVRVTISDNGVGISATNISRIFEPFFYH
jgi:Signal transduction histidine kinase